MYFFAIVATSFGHYGHHQAKVIQKFKKDGYIWCIQLLIYIVVFDCVHI